MSRALLVALTLLLLLPGSVAAKKAHVATSSASLSSSSSSTLEERISAMVEKHFPKARLGLAVRSVHTDSLLLSIAADDWFTPASTLKTLVSAAALDTLPLDWMPVTTLSLDGAIVGHTFLGELRIIGGGDPNVSARYLPQALAVPLAMVDSLKALGVDTVRGALVADTSWFLGSSKPLSWRKKFFDTWYGAEVSALSFNDNAFLLKLAPGSKAGDAIQWSVDPDIGHVEVVNKAITKKGKRNKLTFALDSNANKVTLSGSLGIAGGGATKVFPVRNPAAYFLAGLQAAMRQRGMVLTLDSSVRASVSRNRFQFRTAPLQSILSEVNQRSQNMHAETLLRDLGAVTLQRGTVDGGLQAEQAFLQKIGVPLDGFNAVDGSGLSPENKVKPSAVSLLLSKMARHPRGRFYEESFAIPGLMGSMVHRMADSENAQEMRVKSGYIAGVQALAGYVATGYGDTLAIALYLNGYKGNDLKARQAMDSIWSWIAEEHSQESRSLREARAIWHRADSIGDYYRRIAFFSNALMGRPYLLGPTGEGAQGKVDRKPLMNMERFDCVTFLEHVLALARAKSEDSIFPALQRIRYFDGKIAFESRKHYFVEDWIGHNQGLVALARMPGDTVIVRTMDKKAFFAAKGIAYADSNPKTAIPYLPIDKAIALARSWPGPDTLMGIGFVSNAPNICVFHTGFLFARKGEPLVFRHASQLKGMVAEQPLADYLEAKRSKTPGVLFFAILPQ